MRLGRVEQGALASAAVGRVPDRTDLDPSQRRALARLEGKGLVRQVGDRWVVTDAGHAEMRRLLSP